MAYEIQVIWPDKTKVSNDRDTAETALKDAQNAIPGGYRPGEFNDIGYDVHVFRHKDAADNLNRHGKLELKCPDGTFISVTKK